MGVFSPRIHPACVQGKCTIRWNITSDFPWRYCSLSRSTFGESRDGERSSETVAPDGHQGEQCPKVGMESIHTHFSGYGLGSQHFNTVKLVRLFGADWTGRFAGYPPYHKSKPALPPLGGWSDLFCREDGNYSFSLRYQLFHHQVSFPGALRAAGTLSRSGTGSLLWQAW